MNLVIIQARLGSSRLPGKVLMEIEGKPILGHLLDRLATSRKADKFVVATSISSKDDDIEAFCERYGVDCFRGDEHDVLDRYYNCAEGYIESGDRVIRIMADSPLHHGEVLDFVIDQFDAFKGDFFSNSNQPPDYLEDGCDVEMFTFDALKTAWREADMTSQREHVAPYIKTCGKFKCGFRMFNPDWTHKLSVDTQEDLNMVSAIFKHFAPNDLFTSKEITDLLLEHPQLLELNKDSRINEGYDKSLKEDKRIK